MKYVTILATATFVLAMHSLAIADQPNKIKNITYSSWSTTYKAPNGRNVKAQLAFEGENGFYKTDSLKGKLAEINYDDTGAGGIIITGVWSAGNQKGSFKFTISQNKEKFGGEYTVFGSNAGGTWNGFRTYGYEKWIKDTNSNRYYCKCWFRKQNNTYDYCYCIWHPQYGRYYWCTRNPYTYWGCCNKNKKWWKRGSSWTRWNQPMCPPCPWRCWCFPPPPIDDDDIPMGSTDIPAPPEPDFN